MSEHGQLAELARRITAGAVRLSAATAAWLDLVAEFDAREGWAGYGIRSCAEWLAWQCGLSPGPAREHVRVARALRQLPALTGAFGAGRLSSWATATPCGGGRPSPVRPRNQPRRPPGDVPAGTSPTLVDLAAAYAAAAHPRRGARFSRRRAAPTVARRWHRPARA